MSRMQDLPDNYLSIIVINCSKQFKIHFMTELLKFKLSEKWKLELGVVDTPVIPALGKLRQEDHKFKANLVYTARLGLKKKKKWKLIIYNYN
jgi:hypothetical protein